MFNSLSDRLTATFKNLKGKGRLTEADVDATVREIRRALLDAEEGTDTPPAELYAIAADRADDIRLAALLFILSSVLIVPAVAGMVHLVRDRGATLAHIGGALGVIGAMGHMATARGS